MLKFAVADVISAHTGRAGLARTAHRADFSHHEVRPGYLYVRNRAISSRTNDNFDTFPAEELEKSYQTFIGRPVFVNHVNENHRRARGVIIDAALHRDTAPDGGPDTWVEVLMEVDGVRFPKLAKAILAGEIDKTSMGCDVDQSRCSACGNIATMPSEYCRHIPGQKGLKFQKRAANGDIENVLIHEICTGLRFFENSLLVEPPADPTAHLLGVDASGLKATAAKTAHTMGPESRLDVLVDHMASHHGVGPDTLDRWRDVPGILDHRHRQDHRSGSFNENDTDPDLWHIHDDDDHVAWPGIENEWEGGDDASGMNTTAVRRTAMPSEIHDRPKGFHSRPTDQGGERVRVEPAPVPGACSADHHPGPGIKRYLDGYDPASTTHPEPVATIEYSLHPCGRHVYVDNLETDPDNRGRGYGSALMDDLYSRHPHAVIDHGHRTTDGKGWWDTYDDPDPDRSVSDATRHAEAHTARYSDTGPHCTRCHHLAGTGPGCPKCDATKTLKAAIGDLDLDADGHAMTWQYRDAGPTLHGTCNNCARTTELGRAGMRGDNTAEPPAHSQPCPAVSEHNASDDEWKGLATGDTFARTLPAGVDSRPFTPEQPRLPASLNTARTAGYSYDGDWDGEDDDEEREEHAKNWDDIHEYLGDIHRGIGVHLHPEDHAIVHDRNRSTAERAAHLLKMMPRPHLAGEGSVGWHWTSKEGVAEDFAHRSYDPRQEKAGRPATAVVLHAHKPDRGDIDETPDHTAGEVYGYHDHGEQEVPLYQGAGVSLRGISWKDMDGSDAAARRAGRDPEDYWDPKEEDFTHHDFGHPGHHVTAARDTLTAVFAGLAKTASEDTYDDDDDDDGYDGEDYTTCDRGHRHWGTNGAAGLLIVHHHPDKGPAYLLGRRADKDVDHGGTWSTPGGAIHDDEPPEHAAHREAREELGRLPHLAHVHTHTDDHGGWAYHTVIARAARRFTPRGGDGDGENDDYGWFTPDQFRHLDLHPGFAASWPQIAPHTRRTGARRTAARGSWWDAYTPQAQLRNTGVMDQGRDYNQGKHAAPGKDLAPLHDPYRNGHLRQTHFGDQEMHDTLDSAHGNPDARVSVYRAVPTSVRAINKGDWVTLSSAFARRHAEGLDGGGRDGHVLHTRVKARHITTDGVDLDEWGYHGPAVPQARIHWAPRKEPYSPDYAGGAVALSPEDHDFVHDSTRPVAERAHRLMSAIPRYSRDKGPYVAGGMHQNKGSFTGRKSDAHIDAQDNADQLDPGPRPHTLFMLHSPQNSQPITGVSFARHTPPETPMSAYTHHTWGPDEVDEGTGMRRTASLTVEAMPPRHADPADHPFFKSHPVSAANVVAHWAKANEEEKNQGMRWYADAHLLAKALGDTYAAGDTGKAAGVLSAYSPRSAWPANMHNAARSLASGKALDVGEGMSIMGVHHTLAKKIMDGQDYDTVLKGPKTNAFAKLIHHGGTDLDTGAPQQHVVIDRHALSVACGKRLSEKDAEAFPSSTPHYYNHAAKTYVDAASAITKTEGRTVPPHAVQAVTWLVRKRLNRAEDLAAKGGGGKGRVKMQDNTSTGWNAAHPHLLPGGLGDNMHLSMRETLRRVEGMGDGDYRMMHQAPDEKSGDPLHEVYGEDPDELHTVYRAVPRHINEINKGDWVTHNAEYAHRHALELEPGRRHGHVLQAQVPARHLYTDHNDENEVGYAGPDLHGVDTHEHMDFPETMHSDDDENEDERPPYYAGGAAHLSPEDHHLVHHSGLPVATRAHHLMSVLPNDYGPYTASGHHTGYWDDDPDMAQIDADMKTDDLPASGHPHPATQFVLHSREDQDAAHGVSFAEHGPEKMFDSDLTHHTWDPREVDLDTGMRKTAADDDYRIQHQPDADFGAPLHDLASERHGTFPKDVYDHLDWYTGAPDGEMTHSVHRAKGEPDKKIRIYRGVPRDVKHINTGDWVTLSREYAVQHVKSNVPGGHVLSIMTPAKHIISGGDDLQEWGYHGPAREGLIGWKSPRPRKTSLKTQAAGEDPMRDPFELNDWHDADSREDAKALQHQFAGASGRVTTHPYYGAVYRATHPSGWYADYSHGSNGISIGHAGSDEQAGEPVTHDAVEFPNVHPHEVHGPFVDQMLHHWVLNHHQDYAGTPSNAEIPAYMRRHRLPHPDPQAMSDAQALEGMNFRAMLRRTAYGETKAPADVDTLRTDSCDVCGNTEGWDGQDCPVCLYKAPPTIFRDPDTSVARDMDLRGLGDRAIDTALAQGADTVPGGPDQSGQLPGGDTADAQGAPGPEPAGGETEDPRDATADGDVRTLADGEPQDGAQDIDPDTVSADTADPQGPGAPLPGGPEGAAPPGAADPGMEDPADPSATAEADVLSCPACGYQTEAGPPVSAVTADPAAPASAGPVAGDVCPNCGKAILVSEAELEGAAPPPEVPAEDPEAMEAPQDQAQPPKPKSPAVKRVS